MISTINSEIVVEPGESIVGTVPVDAFNPYDPAARFPVGATVTWGDRETQPWRVASHISPGWHSLNVSINKTAPQESGIYHIVIASGPRYDIAQVLSGTTAARPAVWNDGNDLGWDFDQAQLDESATKGFTRTPILDNVGNYAPSVQGVAAITVRVK